MPSVALPTLNKSRSRTNPHQLIETANRGDLKRVPGWPWDRYAIDGRVRTDGLTVIAQLIRDGLLYDTNPQAKTSEIRPTPAALAKIGATR